MEPLEPPDEKERLRALLQQEILDTLPEPRFDRIVSLAAEICQTPIALFTLVDDQRQWFKARVGLEATETSRAISFCGHSIANDAMLVVEDATKDARFANNPLVVDEPGIRFYAGIPVRSADNHPLGTLCVIDKEAKSLPENHRLLLEGLAREIEAQLEIRRITREQQKLVDERTILTNMIVHDARSVFCTMGLSLEMFKEQYRSDTELIDQLQGSVQSLQQLCEGVAIVNADGSRGLGVSLQDTNLRPWFDSTVVRATTATRHAGMNFESDLDVPDGEVRTDTNLLERIVGNLCANAIQACPAGATISLRGGMESDDTLVLIVDDDGPGVHDEDVNHIFEPYFSHRNATQNGDGLGLAICRLAAQALGGSIEYAARVPSGASFIVRLPA